MKGGRNKYRLIMQYTYRPNRSFHSDIVAVIMAGNLHHALPIAILPFYPVVVIIYEMRDSNVAWDVAWTWTWTWAVQ